MGNQIEGELPAGSRVLVVEDLISTGGSSLKAVEAMRVDCYHTKDGASSTTNSIHSL